MIEYISDNIYKDNLIDIIRIHLYIKMIDFKIDVTELSPREIGIISALYVYGGLKAKSDMKKFSKYCLDNKVTSSDSVQSVRNALGKARALGIVKRPKANIWDISINYLKRSDRSDFVFKYVIYNVKV